MLAAVTRHKIGVIGEWVCFVSLVGALFNLGIKATVKLGNKSSLLFLGQDVRRQAENRQQTCLVNEYSKRSLGKPMVADQMLIQICSIVSVPEKKLAKAQRHKRRADVLQRQL